MAVKVSQDFNNEENKRLLLKYYGHLAVADFFCCCANYNRTLLALVIIDWQKTQMCIRYRVLLLPSSSEISLLISRGVGMRMIHVPVPTRQEYNPCEFYFQISFHGFHRRRSEPSSLCIILRKINHILLFKCSFYWNVLALAMRSCQSFTSIKGIYSTIVLILQSAN